MAVDTPMVSGRPVTLAAACAVFAYYALYPMPKTIGAIFSDASDPGLFVSVLVGLSGLLVCTVLVWLRFGSARWVLAAAALSVPFVDAFSVAAVQEDLSFITALLAILSNDWEYWLLLISAGLLFAPPSSRWFREKQVAAT